MLILDIVVTTLQLLRGLVLPFQSSEVQISHPFIRYQLVSPSNRYTSSLTNPDLPLLLDQPDELAGMPVFEIDWIRYLMGILFGMSRMENGDDALRIQNQEQIAQLRSAFRWNLIRFNHNMRQNRMLQTGPPPNRLPV